MDRSLRDAELLLQLVAIGAEIVRIADHLGEDLAATHIAAGLDILRVRAEITPQLGERLFDEAEPLTRERDEESPAIAAVRPPLN